MVWTVWAAHDLTPLLVFTIAAATAFVMLLVRCSPHRASIRLGVYLCGLLANQAPSMVAGFWPLLPGRHLTEVPATVGRLLAYGLAAAVAVGTYLLVRSWVVGSQECGPRPTMPWRQTAGLGATVAVMYVMALSLSLMVWALAGTVFGIEQTSYPNAPGHLGAFLISIAIGLLAGAMEEPVYVGVIVLLWPKLRARTFVPLALLSSTARGVMHLYYAAGTTRMAAAVALVMLWCLLWSSAALYLTYRARMVWPVVLGHAMTNFISVCGGPFDIEGTPLNVTVLVVVFLSAVLIGGVVVRLAVKDSGVRISWVLEPIIARRWPDRINSEGSGSTIERSASKRFGLGDVKSARQTGTVATLSDPGSSFCMTDPIDEEQQRG